MRTFFAFAASVSFWAAMAPAIHAQASAGATSSTAVADAAREAARDGTRPRSAQPTSGDTLSDFAKRWNRHLAISAGPTVISMYARSSPAQRAAFGLDSLLTPAALARSPVVPSCRSVGAEGLRPKTMSAWLPDSSGWWNIEVFRLADAAPNATRDPARDAARDAGHDAARDRAVTGGTATSEGGWQAIMVERGWPDGRWVRGQLFAGILSLRAYRPDGEPWELYVGGRGTHAASAPMDSLPVTVLFPAGDSLATQLRGLAERLAALDCATLRHR